MGRFAVILAFVSTCLGIIAVAVEQFGGDRLVIVGATIRTTQLFLIVVLLATVAIVLRLSGEDRRADSPRLYWIGGVIVLGIVALSYLGSRQWHSEREIIDQFQTLYFREDRLKSNFLGIASLQYPTDNWTMQEIISELKPDVIVETGTNAGGTALYYATILEKVNPRGKIITVDVGEQDPRVAQMPLWQQHVEAIRGSSTADEVVQKIRARVQGLKVLVTLDSLHTKEHVLKEMQLYSPLVSVNSYLIVQDTQLMGHPIPLWIYSHEGREGPYEAVQEFLSSNKNFVVDRQRERFLLTANPSGYLKRLN